MWIRQDTAGMQVWHPDGTPYSPADYEKAGMPVPTPERLAHWAEIEQLIDEMKARHDTE
ncbi:MAG: hypothetical protein OYM47_17180 [Gemmatimonadota bacterium]|nr:hypothetical protein [Gemmatimonadota bacterium]